MAGTAADIDLYLAGLPEPHRAALESVRAMIHELAPEAAESFGYGIPAFTYKGRPLIYFGAAKKHCALYGTAVGTIRFAPEVPPPAAQLRELLAARSAEIDARAAVRTGKRPTPPTST